MGIDDFPRGLNTRHQGTDLVAQQVVKQCQSRRHSFDPWYMKIPYAAGQLNLFTTTTEAAF